MLYSSQKEGVSMGFYLGERCSLCGGKLDSEKRCTECGLDNTKNDEMYRGMMNQNNGDDIPLTHVHTEEIHQASHAKPANTYRANTYNVGKQKRAPQQSQKKGEKQESRIAKVISIIIIIFGFLPTIFNMLGDIGGGREEMVQEESIYLDYEYENFLGPGLYKVGVHIPAGTYSIELDCGTYGTVSTFEYDGDTFYNNEGFTLESDETEYIVDLYLYEGEVLHVSSEITVYVYSYDIDSDYYVEENMLTESHSVVDSATAGVDFEPGYYDIYYVPYDDIESGSILYNIWDAKVDNFIFQSSQYLGADLGQIWYCNVPFTEGSTIDLFGIHEIMLVPSGGVDPYTEW